MIIGLTQAERDELLEGILAKAWREADPDDTIVEVASVEIRTSKFLPPGYIIARGTSGRLAEQPIYVIRTAP